MWVGVEAQAWAAAAPVYATAPAAAGQSALAVGFDAKGTLRAKLCAAGPCNVDGGHPIDVPSGYMERAAKSTLTVVPLGKGRRAIVVKLPGATDERAWQGVYASAIGKRELVTVFQGETGLIEGEWGERHGPMLQVSEPRADGTRTLLVGEAREDLNLCGRPTILSPRLLSPNDLTLKPAKVQRLPPMERDVATVLTAEAVTEAASGLPLLRALGASSATGDPKALTDGDPDTAWSENRGGDGRGELVMMAAPHELPLTGFEFVVRPAGKELVDGASPRSFFLATDKQLYRVEIAKDAWLSPGARYQVTLPASVQTGCVALVLDTAFSTSKKARVSMAELSARTEVDAQGIAGLVGALAGGGQRSQTAAAALTLLGSSAFEAVAKAYKGLDEGGRRTALEVMDHAPCEQSAAVYVDALIGPFAAHRTHALARLPRCADAAQSAVEAAMDREPRHMLRLAAALADIAPARAVHVILPRLARAKGQQRRVLRFALGRAASSSRASAALRSALGDASLAPESTLDLLRALGPRVGDHGKSAVDALLRVPSTGFRERYLRLEPAGHLAPIDARAKALVAEALTRDANKHVRTRAAEVIAVPTLFQNELMQALSDPEVRVREAAAVALTHPRGQFASQALVVRLQSDAWPIVRAAAADALAKLPSNPGVDAALGDATTDESRHVRGPALTALGARRARSQAPKVRARLEMDDESPDVRARAAEALGLMCDRDAVELLTRSARKLSDPMLPAEERGVSTMSLGALGRLRPPDLERRLAPLRAKGASHTARAAAEATLRSSGSCPPSRIPKRHGRR